MSTFRPIKIAYTLIVGEYDDDGNLIGEHPQDAVALYAPQFDELADRVAAVMNTPPVPRPA